MHKNCYNYTSLYHELLHVENNLLKKKMHKNCACIDEVSSDNDNVLPAVMDSERNAIKSQQLRRQYQQEQLEKLKASLKDKANDEILKNKRKKFRRTGSRIKQYINDDLTFQVTEIGRLTPDFHDKNLTRKINEIDLLDNNINSLIFKTVEVHADILTLDAETTRLLKETKKLLQELEDVKFLDELIELLNSDIGPVIHKEWRYTIDPDILYNQESPIEEGIIVI